MVVSFMQVPMATIVNVESPTPCRWQESSTYKLVIEYVYRPNAVFLCHLHHTRQTALAERPGT